MIFIETNPNYFEMFYIISMLLSLSIFLILSRKGYSQIKSVFIFLLITRTFFVIGSKLLGISSFNDFLLLLNGTQYYGRSALGGLLFAIIGIIVASKLTSIKLRIIDFFAISVPFALGIQKVGCFINGCCYGTITDVPWAINYSSSNHVYYFQSINNYIEVGSKSSAAIHPVQLYESILLLAICIIAYLLRNTFKKKYSLILFTISLFASMRLLLSKFRSDIFYRIEDEFISGLANIQLILFVTIIVCIIILIYNENNEVVFKRKSTTVFSKQHTYIIYVLFFILFLINNLLDKLDVIALLMLMLPIVVLEIRDLIMRSQIKLIFILSFILLISSPLYLLAQIIPEWSDSINTKSYYKMDAGYISGDYFTQREVSGGYCGKSYIGNYHQNYQSFAIGASRVDENHKKKYVSTFGVDLSIGKHSEEEKSLGIYSSINTYNVYPYVRVDNKWFGFKLGMHFGNNVQADSKMDELKTIENFKVINLMPSFSVRLFPTKYLYIQYGYYDYFPSPFPSFKNSILIGRTINKSNGFDLQFGTLDLERYMLKSTIPLGKSINFAPMISWGQKNPGSDINASGELVYYSFSMSYKFNEKNN